MKLIFTFFALLLISLSSAAANFSLSAGIAAVEITPPAEMMNWVYQKPYGGVHDPLFVRALVLSDGTNRVARPRGGAGIAERRGAGGGRPGSGHSGRPRYAQRLSFPFGPVSLLWKRDAHLAGAEPVPAPERE
jgi:hypothetical protein